MPLAVALAVPEPVRPATPPGRLSRKIRAARNQGVGRATPILSSARILRDDANARWPHGSRLTRGTLNSTALAYCRPKVARGGSGAGASRAGGTTAADEAVHG